jgi:hypothetical protein
MLRMIDGGRIANLSSGLTRIAVPGSSAYADPHTPALTAFIVASWPLKMRHEGTHGSKE